MNNTEAHLDARYDSPAKPLRNRGGRGRQVAMIAALTVSGLVTVLRFLRAAEAKPYAPPLMAVPEFARVNQPDAAPAHPQPFPADASRDAPFTNSLGMKFVPVPGTRVLFCTHETRNDDYAAFFAEARGDVRDDWKTLINNAAEPFVLGEDGKKAESGSHPVVVVSWREATAFCKWLSKKESRTYRLPTDREWSVAAGIPEEPVGEPEKLDGVIKDKYPWGNSMNVKSIQGNLNDQTAKERFPDFRSIPGYTDGYATTAPVMSFAPNALGIYDLAGNVSEYCQDSDVPGGSFRIFRGSNWATFAPEGMLTSYRNSYKPDPIRCEVWLGFRIVLAEDAPVE